MESASQLILVIGLATFALALVVVVVLRRRHARRAAAMSPRRTQFGLSAVDPAIADNFRAAWERIAEPEPDIPIDVDDVEVARDSRTSIGYAVTPRMSGLRDDGDTTTTFDATLPSYIERHYRQHVRFARGSQAPIHSPKIAAFAELDPKRD